MPPPSPVRCRQIEARDLAAVEDALTRGFPARPRRYWTTAIATLAARACPPGCPRFGFLLEAQGAVVGVLLLIFSQAEGAGAPIRCNTSSWCVDPAFRSHAAMLAAIALRFKHVTYLNTSATSHTWPILEALGFRRYSQGQFVAVPALSGGAGKVARLDARAEHRALADYALLRAHADAGCLVAVCETPGGPRPFVFLRRRIAYAPAGVMQLVYCRDTADLVACARPLGWFLLAQRALFVICDADGPVAGLAGVYFANKTPRFFKGPERPRANDLAFTEMVLFGP